MVPRPEESQRLLAKKHADSFHRPWVVLVGGFLGAGKTTLLLAAARELERRGLRSALILNDQGDALVDSHLVSLHEVPNGEVTGGCFCCRFSELIEVMDQMRAFAPDVIFAEPVGSCTDISATTLLPLMEYTATFRPTAFTVLVDPARAKELLHEHADSNLKFLFEKQIQEADLICFSKADLGLDLPVLGGATIRQVSAKTGLGVAAWLDEVLAGSLSAGQHTLTIDYAEYARAEAALAWLNLEAIIELDPPVSGAMILGPLLDHIDDDCTSAGVTIVHLKSIIRSEAGYIKAAICSNGEEPALEGALDASPSFRHDLLINLRAVGDAATVRTIVESNIEKIDGTLHGVRIHCFHPAAPQPERRVIANSRHSL